MVCCEAAWAVGFCGFYHSRGPCEVSYGPLFSRLSQVMKTVEDQCGIQGEFGVSDLEKSSADLTSNAPIWLFEFSFSPLFKQWILFVTSHQLQKELAWAKKYRWIDTKRAVKMCAKHPKAFGQNRDALLYIKLGFGYLAWTPPTSSFYQWQESQKGRKVPTALLTVAFVEFQL